MTKALLTSQNAAQFLNVGVSTIKRWADKGIVPCIRTAGGHRRFDRDVLMAHSARALASRMEASRWIGTLLESGGVHHVASALHGARHRLGAWWRVAHELGEVLTELGRRWAEGTLSILEEHAASERLRRGLTLVMAGMPMPPEPRTVLLLAAEGEEHTLGLSLVELCAREAGWMSRWSGRDTPYEEVAHGLSPGEVTMVAVSASTHSDNAADLAGQCARLEAITDQLGSELILGGNGAWPNAPQRAQRIRRFEALHRLFTGAEEP